MIDTKKLYDGMEESFMDGLIRGINAAKSSKSLTTNNAKKDESKSSSKNSGIAVFSNSDKK